MQWIKRYSIFCFLYPLSVIPEIITLVLLSAQTSGTTVTFVIIDGWVVTVASVGDSRCILESAEGSIYCLSADHRLDVNIEE